MPAAESLFYFPYRSGTRYLYFFSIFDVTKNLVKRIIVESLLAESTPKMNSEELNIEFLAHKQAAFRYAVALLHNPSEAEDLTQDLYEKLWRRRLLLRKKGFYQLMMTAMRNLCLDLLRAKERRRGIMLPTSAEEPPPPDKELIDLVGRIIATLPEKEREVIHLRDYEGWEFSEIAEFTGSSLSAVRMACSRARQKVKEQLIKTMNYGV